MSVAYIFDDSVGLFHYGPKHPMKPFRIAVTHSLVKSLGLDKAMTIIKPEIKKLTYHTRDYFDELGAVETSDCPSFPGLKEFCSKYASATINGASLLPEYEVVINWGGGLHHAHKNEPSGFCFVNDIVMAILELLKSYERVMYIDIDVQHADGVEEAFLTNDRVLTVSLHKFGQGFFPETGGLITGKYRAVNVPLLTGIDDSSYHYIFETVIEHSVKKFRPSAIVMQCGADSLAEDRLGVFNLSIPGHAHCVKFVKSYGIPLLLLGGGGYTLTNVSRCWAYETAVVCEREDKVEIDESNPFYSYFSPSYSLTPKFKKRFTNKNDKEYLDAITSFICEKIDEY